MTPYASLADDFYVNMNLATEIELPAQRETILQYFERVQKRFPSMRKFYCRDKRDYVLEEDKDQGRYRWAAVEAKRLCSGQVNPSSIDDALEQHRLVLDLAPAFLSVSPLECEALDVLFGFDFAYRGNHNALLAEALGVGPALERLGDAPGARVINYEPSLTIAIESGSERMRQVVNKKLSSEEIYSAARYAKEGGLTGLKLYGMVGLPTEEDTDVEATAELLLALKKATPGLRLTLGVSSFVPKAHTPFQWQGVRPEAEKRLKLLSKRLQPKGIELRPESYGWSVIQALLSRSDRRLAPVIAAARGDHASLGGWKKAYRAVVEGDTGGTPAGVSPLPVPPPWQEVVHGEWSSDRVLPWEHLDGPLPKATLVGHRQQALGG